MSFDDYQTYKYNDFSPIFYSSHLAAGIRGRTGFVMYKF